MDTLGHEMKYLLYPCHHSLTAFLLFVHIFSLGHWLTWSLWCWDNNHAYRHKANKQVQGNMYNECPSNMAVPTNLRMSPVTIEHVVWKIHTYVFQIIFLITVSLIDQWLPTSWLVLDQISYKVVKFKYIPDGIDGMCWRCQWCLRCGWFCTFRYYIRFVT